MQTKRRDVGRPRGRSIEQAILSATLDLLVEAGVEGLSVARVAERSLVNKTTIYRRWPTRERLVAAALEAALRETSAGLADTGSLRGDLLHMVGLVAARLDSVSGRALTLAAISEPLLELSPDPSLRAQPEALVARAVARGEWDPERYPPALVQHMLTGAVMHRLYLERLPVTPEWSSSVVELLLGGGLRGEG